MKVDIIKKTEFIARDEQGNEYPLENFYNPIYENIEHADVKGKLVKKNSKFRIFLK